MIQKIQITLIIVLMQGFSLSLFSQTVGQTVLIETSMGNMKCGLFEETPMHAENFIKLAKEGFYEGILFHRVMNNFMIQCGDPLSKKAQKGQALGYGDPGYTIPPEFHPDLYHRKGVMATARQPDQINPNKESNGSQFYFVQGIKLSDQQLDAMEKDGSHISFTPEQRMIYKSIGGTPHLDYSYTVFGEVLEGLEIIDKIAAVPVDQRNRPIEDVKIIRVTVLE